MALILVSPLTYSDDAIDDLARGISQRATSLAMWIVRHGLAHTAYALGRASDWLPSSFSSPSSFNADWVNDAANALLALDRTKLRRGWVNDFLLVYEVLTGAGASIELPADVAQERVNLTERICRMTYNVADELGQEPERLAGCFRAALAAREANLEYPSALRQYLLLSTTSPHRIRLDWLGDLLNPQGWVCFFDALVPFIIECTTEVDSLKEFVALAKSYGAQPNKFWIKYTQGALSSMSQTNEADELHLRTAAIPWLLTPEWWSWQIDYSYEGDAINRAASLISMAQWADGPRWKEVVDHVKVMEEEDLRLETLCHLISHARVDQLPSSKKWWASLLATHPTVARAAFGAMGRRMITNLDPQVPGVVLP